MTERVPSLDFRDRASAAFAAALREAYARYGFVVITDHGIDAALIERFLAIYRAFFVLPESVKRRYHVPGGGGARGYTPFGIETAKGSEHHDLKEFWHVGRELAEGHRFRAMMAPNLWVEEIPGFRATSLAMFEAFDAIGRDLLRAIARTLALPPDFFDATVDEGNSVLRVIHYPPLDATPTGSVRAGAHEDINVITLLLGAEEPGLQIRTRAGEWLPINPEPGSLVCNVGDMLQRLTNHRLRSTSHRVINPASDRAAYSRYSMPFFLHFNPDFEIRTLPGCIDAEHPDLYPEPISSHEFLQQRLREIRLI